MGPTSKDVLSRLLGEAFDCGRAYSRELRHQCVDEIAWSHFGEACGEWAVLGLSVLKGLEPGRALFHRTLGLGAVSEAGGQKFVQFAGFRLGLADEGWPWDQPVQLQVGVSHMKITQDVLKSLLLKAFDQGYAGCHEFREESVADILAEWNAHRQRDEEFRVYTVAELNKCRPGTIFQHSVRGRCWIATQKAGGVFVQFQSGEGVSLFGDIDPWDKPMRLLYSPADFTS